VGDGFLWVFRWLGRRALGFGFFVGLLGHHDWYQELESLRVAAWVGVGGLVKGFQLCLIQLLFNKQILGLVFS
jgi:hypothetical protein